MLVVFPLPDKTQSGGARVAFAPPLERLVRSAVVGIRQGQCHDIASPDLEDVGSFADRRAIHELECQLSDNLIRPDDVLVEETL